MTAEVRSAPALPVAIRRLQEADLPGLEWSPDQVRFRRMFRSAFEDMRAGTRSLWVGAAGRQVVGRLFIQWNSSDTRYADGVSRAYIYALRVHTDWQGQGVGTRLITAAEGELCDRRFSIATLAVGQDNAAAFRLYQRLGYSIFGEDPGVWYFTDDQGNLQREEERSWLLEKRVRCGAT
jgi:ribosomal protein S18 acetylase RimI-like enzyme